VEFKIGQTYEIYFGPDHFNNKKIEVRGIVDKEWVVWRYKEPYGKKYRYHLEHIQYLKILERDGILK